MIKGQDPQDHGRKIMTNNDLQAIDVQCAHDGTGSNEQGGAFAAKLIRRADA